MSDKELQTALEAIQEEQRVRKESLKMKAWKELREAMRKYLETGGGIEVIDRDGQAIYITENINMSEAGILGYDY